MVHFCGLVRAVPEHASQPFRRVSLPIPEPVTVGPFDPLAMFAESEERTLQELLETFADLRQQSIDRLRALQISETDLDKTGVQPEFGTVTLRQLLATWSSARRENSRSARLSPVSALVSRSAFRATCPSMLVEPDGKCRFVGRCCGWQDAEEGVLAPSPGRP